MGSRILNNPYKIHIEPNSRTADSCRNCFPCVIGDDPYAENFFQHAIENSFQEEVAEADSCWTCRGIAVLSVTAVASVVLAMLLSIYEDAKKPS
jgi:hypothetical protein